MSIPAANHSGSIRGEIEVPAEDLIFVCTEGCPLTLPPRLRIEGAPSVSGRRFFCLVDYAGIVWTNASVPGDSEAMMRRRTWRESLNLVRAFVPDDLFDRVISVASTVQPNLVEMMRKYAEFSSDAVVQGHLSR